MTSVAVKHASKQHNNSTAVALNYVILLSDVNAIALHS
jgi:hypothetical protein